MNWIFCSCIAFVMIVAGIVVGWFWHKTCDDEDNE
jgi:hypothetical protein